jgi:caa(3)-type oxidase subunit IV
MASNSSHSHEHHIVSTGTYFLTLLALVGLMILTVWIAGFNLPSIGPFSGTVVNQVVALVIAVAKALLVITIFMGVRWSSTLAKLWVASGFVTLILLFGILGDYTTRHYEHQRGWEARPDGALPRSTPDEEVIPPANANDLNVKIRQ